MLVLKQIVVNTNVFLIMATGIFYYRQNYALQRISIPTKSSTTLVAMASLLSRKCCTEQKLAKASSFKISCTNFFLAGYQVWFLDGNAPSEESVNKRKEILISIWHDNLLTELWKCIISGLLSLHPFHSLPTPPPSPNFDDAFYLWP